MVLKILSGQKTQTRRIVKPSNGNASPETLSPWMINGVQETDRNGSPTWIGTHPEYMTGSKWFSCPHGKNGDRLWLRETWCEGLSDTHECWGYRADMKYQCGKLIPDDGLKRWKPSIFMPRKYSRLTLEITGVKVERVEDCSSEDAMAEGFNNWIEFIDYFYGLSPEYVGANPWCWCIKFKKVEK